MWKRIAQGTKVVRAAAPHPRGITGLETAIVLIAFVVVSSVFAFAALSTGLFSADQSEATIKAGLDEALGTLELKGQVVATALAVTGEGVADFTGDTGITVLPALASIPVVPGSETVKKRTAGGGGTQIILSRVKSGTSPSATQYTINNKTGVITLGTALVAVGDGGDAITADYAAQDIDEISFNLANSAGGGAVNLGQGKTVIKYSDDNQTFLFDTSAEYRLTSLGNADEDDLVEAGELYEIALKNMVSNLNPDLSTGDTFIVEVIPPEGAVLHIERTIPESPNKRTALD